MSAYSLDIACLLVFLLLFFLVRPRRVRAGLGVAFLLLGLVFLFAVRSLSGFDSGALGAWVFGAGIGLWLSRGRYGARQ